MKAADLAAVQAAHMSEDDLLGHVLALTADLRLLAHHCRPARLADGTWRTPIQGDAGFVDLVIAGPRGVLFRELKSEKGALSRVQSTWIDTLAAAGADGIAGDKDTSVRDAVLALWGDRPAIAFGDLMMPPPHGTKQVLIFAKQVDAGVRGAMAGFRRDAEAIYLLHKWPSGIGGDTSVIRTNAVMVGGQYGVATRTGHPHTKPLDVMEQLIAKCPSGVIADPFAGSGSTLVAARNTGRNAIGVELEERYCEDIAKRLDQGVLDIAGGAA